MKTSSHLSIPTPSYGGFMVNVQKYRLNEKIGSLYKYEYIPELGKQLALVWSIPLDIGNIIEEYVLYENIRLEGVASFLTNYILRLLMNPEDIQSENGKKYVYDKIRSLIGKNLDEYIFLNSTGDGLEMFDIYDISTDLTTRFYSCVSIFSTDLYDHLNERIRDIVQHYLCYLVLEFFKEKGYSLPKTYDWTQQFYAHNDFQLECFIDQYRHQIGNKPIYGWNFDNINTIDTHESTYMDSP